jgi:hypothetical protein
MIIGESTERLSASMTPAEPSAAAALPAKPPLYWRLLRLHTIRPNGWQRALLVEGVFGVAVVLTLADVATAWTLLALPLMSALVVKGHDLLAGLLRRPAPEMRSAPPNGGRRRT